MGALLRVAELTWQYRQGQPGGSGTADASVAVSVQRSVEQPMPVSPVTAATSGADSPVAQAGQQEGARPVPGQLALVAGQGPGSGAASSPPTAPSSNHTLPTVVPFSRGSLLQWLRRHEEARKHDA
jgi:hypothetical protein